MGSKYLDDVMEHSEMDYEEAMETIERQQKMLDGADSGYLDSMDMSTHHKAYRQIEDAEEMSGGRFEPVGDRIKRLEASKRLITLGEQMLHLKNKTNTAMAGEAQSAATELEKMEMARKDYREHVKEVLLAGKRVAADEQHPRKDSKGDADVHAHEYSAGSRRGGDAALQQMQKGVKKMAKGLDAE